MATFRAQRYAHYRPAMLNRHRAAAAAAFTPTDLGAALAAWYDASVIGTLWQDSARTTPVASDGDPVGAMDDRSGNARHAVQATAGSRPTFDTASVNGLSAITFDGGDTLETAAVGAIAQPIQIFQVGLFGSTGATQRLFDGTVSNNMTAFEFGGTLQYASGSSLDTGDAADTSLHMYRLVYNGASSSFTRDSTELHAGDAGANGWNGDTIGGLPGLAGQFLTSGSKFCERLVCQGLSAGQITQVFDYLKAKWGTP